MNIKRKIFYLIGLLGVGVTGLWLLNDSHSALTLLKANNLHTEIFNGFFAMTITQAFHIGLWLTISSIFITTTYTICLLLDLKNK